MIVSSGPASFIARSLSMLRSVGAWMAIAPEQTYVATSIRGLGACKSTYCKAERREPPALAAAFPNGRLAALFAVALAATGLLSGFAAHRQAEARDMAEPDQLGPGIADCQKSAAPVSSGVSAAGAAATMPACGSAPAVAASGRAWSEDFGYSQGAGVRPGAAFDGHGGFTGG